MRARYSVSGRAKRITAGIIALIMLVVMLLASQFIVTHIHHDCSGEDCPVCACMHQCESVLRTIGSGMSGNTAIAVPVLLIFIIISLQAVCDTVNTLVSCKVRLND